jgi:CO/xanthine dehydrogenase FAD-binding subunit
MKSHGKLVIVLVIGVLIGSQIGPIHQALAVAGTAQMDSAVQQIRLAVNNAKEDVRECQALLSTLKNTPLTPAEQQMAKAIEVLGAAQKSMINANEQTLTIIQELGGRLNK